MNNQKKKRMMMMMNKDKINKGNLVILQTHQNTLEIFKIIMIVKNKNNLKKKIWINILKI